MTSTRAGQLTRVSAVPLAFGSIAGSGIHERRREIASLDAILDRLRADDTTNGAVAGAGTGKRLPLLQIKTRGSHESALRKAQPHDDTHPPADADDADGQDQR